MRFFDAVRSKQPTMKRVGGNSCPERIAQEMKGKKKYFVIGRKSVVKGGRNIKMCEAYL